MTPTRADAMPDAPEGRLAQNITHFARALRRAGIPVGPGRVVDAVRAVETAGFTNRVDFFHTLQACFVSRPEHRLIFAQVFRLYWRDPQFLEHMMAMLLPMMRGVNEPTPPDAAERRAAEALLDGIEPEDPSAPDEGVEIEIDASLTVSAQERLKQMDFEQMSTAEVAAAKRAIARLRFQLPPMTSRRMRVDASGQVADWRGTIRASMRHGGEIRGLTFKARRTRWPNLVALCDISGSMSAYSRMLLHFLHHLANEKGTGWADVHAFTFGTELTNITRALRRRDVDAALALAGREARDWDGGTRIGQALHRFNRDWSRRVLGQGAVVLIITDGLDREDPEELAREMERLHLSARQVIWLNPLLRWDGFAARARGIRAMMPHVDVFRSCHNLQSIEELVSILNQVDRQADRAKIQSLLRAGGEAA